MGHRPEAHLRCGRGELLGVEEATAIVIELFEGGSQRDRAVLGRGIGEGELEKLADRQSAVLIRVRGVKPHADLLRLEAFPQLPRQERVELLPIQALVSVSVAVREALGVHREIVVDLRGQRLLLPRRAFLVPDIRDVDHRGFGAGHFDCPR